MRIRCLSYVFILFILFPSIKPENNSIINYIHVLFEWEEISDAEGYFLLLTNVTANNSTITIHSPNPYYVSYNEIFWNTSYLWQICDSMNPSICSDLYSFTTGSEIDLGSLSYLEMNPNEYYDGITIFGSITTPFSAAIDKDGRQIWNSGGLNTFCYFKHDKQGRFYGGKYTGGSGVPGIEFDIDNNILFEEPEPDELEIISIDSNVLQHEIIKINDTQYLFIIPKDQQHPVPLCSTTPGCTDSDGEYFWEEEYLDTGGYHWWRGESVILWDTETNQVEWEWNAFDHIPLNDFDEVLSWGATVSADYYDWTHFNAIDYDSEENAVYLSSRHLSRIYKIALNSYDDPTTEVDETIIWSMGYDQLGNGDVTIELNDENGDYKGFTYQHSLQILDNGNIVTLDNGNLSSILFDDYDGDNKTRALEISVDETTNTAEIVWEYVLDDYLFGDLSGNVQKLNNGNYLITTVADYAHTLEINSSKEVVSDLQYRLEENPNGTIYRAHRITSIHPYGCTDLTACNYDINARVDDNTCSYPPGNECDCNGNVLDCSGVCGGTALDSDNDGICDEIDGCQSSPENWLSNSITDYDSDGCQDETEDNDDDGDDLLDCWDYWYDDGILMAEDELLEMIANGDCEDFELSNGESFIPNQINLLDAYPNPFNPVVNFDINISSPVEININIYSINGMLIESIHNGFIAPGLYSFEWNGGINSSGLYIINLTWDNNSISKKVVLLK